MGTAAHCVDDKVRRQLLFSVSAAVRYPNSDYATPVRIRNQFGDISAVVDRHVV